MKIDNRDQSIEMEAAQKVIRQQLVLLLHAHSCQQKGQLEADFECNLPYCKSTKSVIDHIRGCVDGANCTVEHCAASQQIISHWKHCAQKKRCEICGPIFISQINNALTSMTH